MWKKIWCVIKSPSPFISPFKSVLVVSWPFMFQRWIVCSLVWLMYFYSCRLVDFSLFFQLKWLSRMYLLHRMNSVLWLRGPECPNLWERDGNGFCIFIWSLQSSFKLNIQIPSRVWNKFGYMRSDIFFWKTILCDGSLFSDLYNCHLPGYFYNSFAPLQTMMNASILFFYSLEKVFKVVFYKMIRFSAVSILLLHS